MNRSPFSVLNLAQQPLPNLPPHQAFPSPEGSKTPGASPPASPRLAHGARHSLPELPTPLTAQAPADLPASVGQLALGPREDTASALYGAEKQSCGSKQVTWREESPSPYKAAAMSVTSVTTTITTTTTAHSACISSTSTASVVSTATAGTSVPRASPRNDRKFWSVWSKNKENSPVRPKLQRNTSTPQKGVAVKFSRQRVESSPDWESPVATPKSPDGLSQSERLHAGVARRTPTGQSSSDRPQWKSPHALISTASASPAVAASSGFPSPFARTYSSLELPKFHRIDEPIVVISAWGTVVGTIRIHLDHCMRARPVDEDSRKSIEDAATNLAVELNQSRPSRTGLNEALLQLALLIRDVDPGRFHASVVMKYHITQMAAAIEFMPDELPSRWRTRIESEAVEFGAWVLHGITTNQPDRSESQSQ